MDRDRPWSFITTDFHRADADRLIELHQRSTLISERGFSKEDRGEALREASRVLDVGLSLGVCPWTDNLLIETYDPSAPHRDLVVLVGHDWYPIGESLPLESPLWIQGLHHVDKYRRWCPESFFARDRNRPVIFFLNFYPDFRRPGASKTGVLRERDGCLPYWECMDGLKEVLRLLTPKFERTSIISWGAPVWSALRELVDGGVRRRQLGEQQATGGLLSIAGHPYLPMAHPSFGTNQRKPYLQAMYGQLGLGRPGFELSID